MLLIKKILILLILLVVPYLSLGGLPDSSNPLTPIEKLIDHIESKFKIDRDLAKEVVETAFQHGNNSSFPSPLDILAVTQVESKFKTTAVNKSGPCIGLMQINAGAHSLGYKNLTKPSINLSKGSDLLKEYRGLTKSDSAALVAYNAGPVGMRRICGGNTPMCSSEYSRKVAVAKRELLFAMTN